MVTEAPAMIPFNTSLAKWTPPVTAKSARTLPYRMATQCKRSKDSSERLREMPGESGSRYRSRVDRSG